MQSKMHRRAFLSLGALGATWLAAGWAGANASRRHPKPTPTPTPTPSPSVIYQSQTPAPPRPKPLGDPQTAAPAPPAGLASGALSLTDAVAAATAGSILNASVGRSFPDAELFIDKALTIVGYTSTLVGRSGDYRPAMVALADDVTIEGFAVRGVGVTVGATPPNLSGQEWAAVQFGGYAHGAVQRGTARNLDIADVVIDGLTFQGGSGHQVLACLLGRAGRSALTASGQTQGVGPFTLARSRLHETNLAGYDVGSDGGVVKLLFLNPVLVEDCEFDNNPGRGFWTDTMVRNMVFQRNYSHHNAFNTLFESGHGLMLSNNVFYRDGISSANVPFFSGAMTLSSSDHAEVTGNLIAWCGGGITVISQSRTDDELHIEQYVHDNTIILNNVNPNGYAVGWFDDIGSTSPTGNVVGQLFLGGANNRGARNGIWVPSTDAKFAWNGDLATLAAFNATPGGGGNTRYLSLAERNAALAAAGLPTTP